MFWTRPPPPPPPAHTHAHTHTVTRTHVHSDVRPTAARAHTRTLTLSSRILLRRRAFVCACAVITLVYSVRSLVAVDDAPKKQYATTTHTAHTNSAAAAADIDCAPFRSGPVRFLVVSDRPSTRDDSSPGPSAHVSHARADRRTHLAATSVVQRWYGRRRQRPDGRYSQNTHTHPHIHTGESDRRKPTKYCFVHPVRADALRRRRLGFPSNHHHAFDPFTPRFTPTTSPCDRVHGLRSPVSRPQHRRWSESSYYPVLSVPRSFVCFFYTPRFSTFCNHHASGRQVKCSGLRTTNRPTDHGSNVYHVLARTTHYLLRLLFGTLVVKLEFHFYIVLCLLLKFFFIPANCLKIQ